MKLLLLASALGLLACGANGTAQSPRDDQGGFAMGVYGAGMKGGGGGGVLLGLYSTASIRKPWEGSGVFLELGTTHLPYGPPLDGSLSATYRMTVNTSRGETGKRLILPYLSGGYTRYFVSGNALHYGGGVLWKYSGQYETSKVLGLEYRDNVVAGHGHQPEFRLIFQFEATP